MNFIAACQCVFVKAELWEPGFKMSKALFKWYLTNIIQYDKSNMIFHDGMPACCETTKNVPRVKALKYQLI